VIATRTRLIYLLAVLWLIPLGFLPMNLTVRPTLKLWLKIGAGISLALAVAHHVQENKDERRDP
jgi:hypothetical protein